MGTSAQPNPVLPTTVEVKGELARILASSHFAKSQRMSKFLQVTVEAGLEGNAAALKEYSIGLSVFGREPSFDPRLDPVVRNEARRLRSKLLSYYESDGKTNPLRIDLPKGGYSPVFHIADANPSPSMTIAPAVLTAGANIERAPVLKRGSTYAVMSLVTAIGAFLLFWLLSDRSVNVPNKNHQPNKEAYEAWRIGRRHIEQIDPMPAIPELKKAIQLDPQFADAYATLAAGYGMAGIQNRLPMDIGMRQAKELAERAMSLDPNSAEAHLMLGAAEVFNRDWKRAEDLMRRSLALRNDDAFSLLTISEIVLEPQGKFDEALKNLQRAVQLAPDNHANWDELLAIREHRHEYKVGIVEAALALQHLPSDHWIQGDLIDLYLLAERPDDARRILLENVADTDVQQDIWSFQIAVETKQSSEVQRLAERVLSNPQASDVDRALVYAILGRESEMVVLLNKAEDNHSLSGLQFTKLDPRLDSYRPHAAFQQLLRRMRLIS